MPIFFLFQNTKKIQFKLQRLPRRYAFTNTKKKLNFKEHVKHLYYYMNTVWTCKRTATEFKVTKKQPGVSY